MKWSQEVENNYQNIRRESGRHPGTPPLHRVLWRDFTNRFLYQSPASLLSRVNNGVTIFISFFLREMFDVCCLHQELSSLVDYNFDVSRLFTMLSQGDISFLR